MSFNNQHIILDRLNYQEAFLLYVDGELSPLQMDAVEAFVALHPDLQEELDALLTTKLDDETISFGNKESLLSPNMSAGSSDELLLLYLDNELNGNEQKVIEQRIATDAAFQKQYELLQATKLDKKETIVYPDKKELYRNTQPSVRPMFWLRIAVAVILVLSATIFWWMGNKNSTDLNPASVATTNNNTINQVENKVAKADEGNEKAEAKENNKKMKVIPSIDREKETFTIAKAPGKIKTTSPVKKHIEQLAVQENDFVITKPDPRDRTIAVVKEPTRIEENKHVDALANNPSQQIINTPAVTTIVAEPYNNKNEALNETGVIYASQNNNDKQGSVRGFLRKASRFIERRTGINPVNEDDKLLIGVVAIKL